MKGFVENSLQAAPFVLDTAGQVYSTVCFAVWWNTEAVYWPGFNQVAFSSEGVALQCGPHKALLGPP